LDEKKAFVAFPRVADVGSDVGNVVACVSFGKEMSGRPSSSVRLRLATAIASTCRTRGSASSTWSAGSRRHRARSDVIARRHSAARRHPEDDSVSRAAEAPRDASSSSSLSPSSSHARASPELLRADVQPLQHGDECVAGRLSGVGESAQRGARDGFRFRRPREIRDAHRSGDEVVSDRLKRASRALGRHFERLFVRLVGKRVGDVSRVIVQQRARGVEERVQGRRRVFRVFERDVERSTQSVHSLSLFREITGATARLTPRVVLRHRLGYRRHAPRRTRLPRASSRCAVTRHRCCAFLSWCFFFREK
jgi:hypothetical protein